MAAGSDPHRTARGRRPAPPIQERRWAEAQMATLALSGIDRPSAVLTLRALAWQRVAAQMGLAVPLVVIHDMGAVVTGLGRPAAVPRSGLGGDVAGPWRELLVQVAETGLARSSAVWKHRDGMVGIVLARILGAMVPLLPARVRRSRPRPLPLDLHAVARIDVRDAFARHDTGDAVGWMEVLARHRLVVTLEVEQIDIDALRLMGLYGPGESHLLAGFDLADLYHAIRDPGLADLVDFSLELLPSLLEVRRRTGQQTFGVDGYASIGRRGNLDDLVLSQLAYDDAVFEQKLADRELFFYTHEKQVENEDRLHMVLVDGSASMRGDREVFARGLALALAKRLALYGDTVRLRFFDARIYDGVQVTGRSGAEVPYILQFRGERGRNYRRVAEQLLRELTDRGRRAREVVVYLLTHGSCRFPASSVQQMAQHAMLHGVFILPEGPLDLPYAGALAHVSILDEDAISSSQRTLHARRIIADAERTVRGRVPRGLP